ncbi:tRNA (guanine46-N7-)-methyltransferase [Klebsiella pneumoniae]|uniref:tRNA (guanine(46)-N(7))-methyltransferase n=1 Tax=Klebsiella pneumoniae TaxID=573 RepID=A0A378A787_KLEPN|nr:tRNA (guanine46-N7-)-methyltransferase [Klebsiella pneumoniae]
MKNDVISPEFDENGRPLRRIRSFVRRQGRLTKGQQHALDNIWPVMGVEFNDAPLDFAALFGRDAPVTLEIGFGMGASLVAMAKAKPEQNFLGIEVHSPGVGACLAFCGRRRRTKPARNVSRCSGSATYHDPG